MFYFKLSTHTYKNVKAFEKAYKSRLASLALEFTNSQPGLEYTKTYLRIQALYEVTGYHRYVSRIDFEQNILPSYEQYHKSKWTIRVL